jgi:hypothetical protein
MRGLKTYVCFHPNFASNQGVYGMKDIPQNNDELQVQCAHIRLIPSTTHHLPGV